MSSRREDVHCVQKDLVKPSVNTFIIIIFGSPLSAVSKILLQVLALLKFLEGGDILHHGRPEGPG